MNPLPRPWTKISLLLALALLLTPSWAQNFNVASPLVEEFKLNPGEAVSGQILLQNTTNGPLVVRLSQGDYQLKPGGVEFLPPGSQPRSNTAWIALSQAEVTLPPGGQAAVNYRIQVPKDPNLKGTYFSMIFVEAVEPEPQPPQNPGENTVGLGIVQRLRYAVQLLVNVGESGEPKVSFPKARLVTTTSGAVLEVEVNNEGDRYIRPMVRLDLFREDGASLGSLQQGPITLVPGSGVLLQLTLPKLTPGTYQAALVLDGGGNFVFGKRYRFTLKE